MPQIGVQPRLAGQRKWATYLSMFGLTYFARLQCDLPARLRLAAKSHPPSYWGSCGRERLMPNFAKQNWAYVWRSWEVDAFPHAIFRVMRIVFD